VHIVSGGISGNIFTIPLSHTIFKRLDDIDNLLVSIFPMVFALQMRVVLEKK
jgi:hypothetical protein